MPFLLAVNNAQEQKWQILPQQALAATAEQLQ
jgi:hypothetical protein